jgi:UDP-N-acetylmuramate dehydrogenase
VTAPDAIKWLDGLSGVRAGEPLAPHTTYRIGGPAERYLELRDRGRLAEVVAGCARRGIPLLALGNGSNLLVADAGVEGLVVRLTDTTINVEGGEVAVGAGARMVRIAQTAQSAGLTGMEWALGIPGTAGGSTCNNAGCFGSDMAATVISVDLVDGSGASVTVPAAACEFRYRGSAIRDGALAGHIVTGVHFGLRRGDRGAIRERMDEIQRERHESQPVKGRSTGSVFKNPRGDYAARLVDMAGLKGTSVGGAMVSPDHANFIVNAGGATAADVAELVRRVQRAVREQSGVELELEMEAVGRWPAGVLP